MMMLATAAHAQENLTVAEAEQILMTKASAGFPGDEQYVRPTSEGGKQFATGSISRRSTRGWPSGQIIESWDMIIEEAGWADLDPDGIDRGYDSAKTGISSWLIKCRAGRKCVERWMSGSGGYEGHDQGTGMGIMFNVRDAAQVKQALIVLAKAAASNNH